MKEIQALGARAKAAASSFCTASTQQKNNLLEAIATELEIQIPVILAANAIDMAAAKKNGVIDTMLDRLLLTQERIRDIAAAARAVIALPDPIGKILAGSTRPNGLVVYNTRVPMGVVGIIFEARPNVTIDAAVICLKSGNGCILRGGKEAINSNKAMVAVIHTALAACGLPQDIVLLVEDITRESATAMMRLNGFIDVLIPRGGAGLIQSVVQNSTVPVIETGAGNCHIYVDESADLDMALAITNNAKVQRPSVCNSAETLLVHKAVAPQLLPKLAQLWQDKVELRACAQGVSYLPKATLATEDDYFAEYNDYIIAIKVVEDVQEAIAHIAKYSTGHSEAIITENYTRANIFLAQVDAAAVYVNASTRFTDGEALGFGAEIGISTQKLHVRGPMGLEELTTNKYLVYGSGQIR